PEDKPVGELLADMTSQVTTLMRKEVEMAMIELKDEMKQAAKAGGMLSGAALSGYLAALFGSFAVAWFLDRKLPRPLAFGLVAMLHGAAAATLLNVSHQKIKEVDLAPTQTIETLKENVEWAKAQRS
ncbi:MAG: phage holin family protein, partial [Actinomycetota bacterium]|nr:phage holin family protein [Actinomycetota bacterium]